MSEAAPSAGIDPHPETRVAAALARFPDVVKVWLFGSRARGDHMPLADIDIAVETVAIDTSLWFDMQEAADEATLFEVDVVRLENTDGDFRQAILSEGRLLYERA